jgi:hypothetical protein
MRGAWIIAAALVVGGTAAGPARAGVYFTSGTLVRPFANPEDPDAQELWPVPSAFAQFQQDLAAYRAAAAIADPPAGSLGAHYRRRVKELEADEARGTLSGDDRINLGAYYIRLGKYDRAVQLLEPKAREGHFLLLANLATAHELAGAPDLALRYREQALEAWPTMYAGWDRAMLNYYRKAEEYHKKLLLLRQERARRQPGQAAPLELDNLFPQVRLTSPGRPYKVGEISPKQWGEVPPDASNLVMQLLLWMPFDDGLHWLLGELLNASGDVAGAAAMMKAVVEKPPDPTNPRWNAKVPDELQQHYAAVSAVAEARRKLSDAVIATGDPYFNLKLLCAVTPRGMGLGAGDLMQEASWTAIVKASEPPPPSKDEGGRGTTTPPPTSTGWMPNWRELGVGFAAGALVALLLGYQVRQARQAKG